MSLFRIVKYSSLIYFLGRHRSKLFRSLAVLLFALVTSLLYEDVRGYLEIQHPGTLLYALLAKILIVYGALAFVLWQFRPRGDGAPAAAAERSKTAAPAAEKAKQVDKAPKDRLDALTDLERHDRLRSRYDRILAGEEKARRG